MKRITFTSGCSVITILFMFSFIGGCATERSAAAVRIQEADMKIVDNCKFIGDVHGSSVWGGTASIGMQNAKNEALESAASMSATHVVWTNIVSGPTPFVNGKAYSCK